MSIHVSWSPHDDEALVVTFDGDWSWTDYYEMGTKVRSLMADTVKPVHVVYDLRPSTANPRSPVLHLRHYATHLPENGRQGLHVYVGATTFWKSCITAFTRVYPALAPDIVYVSGLEDAQDAIERKKEQNALLIDDTAEVRNRR